MRIDTRFEEKDGKQEKIKFVTKTIVVEYVKSITQQALEKGGIDKLDLELRTALHAELSQTLQEVKLEGGFELTDAIDSTINEIIATAHADETFDEVINIIIKTIEEKPGHSFSDEELNALFQDPSSPLILYPRFPAVKELMRSMQTYGFRNINTNETTKNLLKIKFQESMSEIVKFRNRLKIEPVINTDGTLVLNTDGTLRKVRVITALEVTNYVQKKVKEILSTSGLMGLDETTQNNLQIELAFILKGVTCKGGFDLSEKVRLCIEAEIEQYKIMQKFHTTIKSMVEAIEDWRDKGITPSEAELNRLFQSFPKFTAIKELIQEMLSKDQFTIDDRTLLKNNFFRCLENSLKLNKQLNEFIFQSTSRFEDLRKFVEFWHGGDAEIVKYWYNGGSKPKATPSTTDSDELTTSSDSGERASDTSSSSDDSPRIRSLPAQSTKLGLLSDLRQNHGKSGKTFARVLETHPLLDPKNKIFCLQYFAIYKVVQEIIGTMVDITIQPGEWTAQHEQQLMENIEKLVNAEHKELFDISRLLASARNYSTIATEMMQQLEKEATPRGFRLRASKPHETLISTIEQQLKSSGVPLAGSTSLEMIFSNFHKDAFMLIQQLKMALEQLKEYAIKAKISDELRDKLTALVTEYQEAGLRQNNSGITSDAELAFKEKYPGFLIHVSRDKIATVQAQFRQLFTTHEARQGWALTVDRNKGDRIAYGPGDKKPPFSRVQWDIDTETILIKPSRTMWHKLKHDLKARNEMFIRMRDFAEYIRTLSDSVPPCDLVWRSSPPTKDTLHILPITSNFAYVCSNGELFYIDKIVKTCVKIEMDEKKWDQFKSKFNSTEDTITLLEDQLKNIRLLTGHIHGASIQVVNASNPKEIGNEAASSATFRTSKNQLKADFNQMIKVFNQISVDDIFTQKGNKEFDSEVKRILARRGVFQPYNTPTRDIAELIRYIENLAIHYNECSQLWEKHLEKFNRITLELAKERVPSIAALDKMLTELESIKQDLTTIYNQMKELERSPVAGVIEIDFSKIANKISAQESSINKVKEKAQLFKTALKSKHESLESFSSQLRDNTTSLDTIKSIENELAQFDTFNSDEIEDHVKSVQGQLIQVVNQQLDALKEELFKKTTLKDIKSIKTTLDQYESLKSVEIINQVTTVKDQLKVAVDRLLDGLSLRLKIQNISVQEALACLEDVNKLFEFAKSCSYLKSSISRILEISTHCEFVLDRLQKSQNPAAVMEDQKIIIRAIPESGDKHPIARAIKAALTNKTATVSGLKTSLRGAHSNEERAVIVEVVSREQWPIVDLQDHGYLIFMKVYSDVIDNKDLLKDINTRIATSIQELVKSNPTITKEELLEHLDKFSDTSKEKLEILNAVFASFSKEKSQPKENKHHNSFGLFSKRKDIHMTPVYDMQLLVLKRTYLEVVRASEKDEAIKQVVENHLREGKDKSLINANRTKYEFLRHDKVKTAGKVMRELNIETIPTP